MKGIQENWQMQGKRPGLSERINQVSERRENPEGCLNVNNTRLLSLSHSISDSNNSIVFNDPNNNERGIYF